MTAFFWRRREGGKLCASDGGNHTSFSLFFVSLSHDGDVDDGKKAQLIFDSRINKEQSIMSD